MSLARLFYLKETFRENLRRWRRTSFVKRRSPIFSVDSARSTQSSVLSPRPFALESLEPRLLLSVSIADAAVVESNTTFSPSLVFGVTLSEAAATDVTVQYQTIGLRIKLQWTVAANGPLSSTVSKSSN